MNSSAPVTMPPPDAVVSITTSSVNTARICSHCLVSMVRKYRALSCLIASTSSISLPVR